MTDERLPKRCFPFTDRERVYDSDGAWVFDVALFADGYWRRSTRADARRFRTKRAAIAGGHRR